MPGLVDQVIMASNLTGFKAIVLNDIQDTDLTADNQMSILLTPETHIGRKIKSVIIGIYQGFLDEFDFEANNNEPEIPALKQRCTDIIDLLWQQEAIDLAQPLPHASTLTGHELSWSSEPDEGILVAIDPDGFRYYYLTIKEIVDCEFHINYSV